MLVELVISDGLFKQYQTYNPSDPYKALSFQLRRFADVPPGDRVITIDAENRRKLEALLNESTTDANALVNKVKQLLSIQVEGVQVTLTPATLEYLKDQAEFEAAEPKEFLERKIREGVEVAVSGFMS